MTIDNHNIEFNKINNGVSFQPLLEKYEKQLIIVFCVIALVRIFIYTAAFPLFNNVDEQAHFDTVVKYARGYLPSNGNNYYDQESAQLIAQYGTPEYFSRNPMQFHAPTPAVTVDYFLGQKNHEAFSPPVYYAIAGLWYDVGKIIGIQGVNLLYWIRFMNLPIYLMFLGVTYLYCRMTEPKNHTLRIGVLLLLSFIPQDVFYSINSDVLSPLFFISGLFVLTKIYNGNHSFFLWPFAGGLFASTLLIKLSNIPALFILCIMFSLIIKKTKSLGSFSSLTSHALSLIISVLTPIIIWFCFNKYNLGDITGTHEKIRELGWAVKSLNDLGNHPIFTINGLGYFFKELILSFWRGEFIWLFERVASKDSDIMYLLTTLFFMSTGSVSIISENKKASSGNILISYLHIIILFSFVLFLVLQSIRYDFGNCFYPSKESPFFTSGRLILASLVSFVIIYVKGIVHFSEKIFKRIDPFIIILLIALYSAISEIVISRSVFLSPYNFFNF